MNTGAKLIMFAAAITSLLTTSLCAQTTVTLSVRDFGAKGDGSSDDTAAFQRALDSCNKSGGGVLFAPVGRYLIKGHLIIPEYVTLKGVHEAPPVVSEKHGTTLLAVENKGKEDGDPFITMHRGAGLHGVQVFYPEQSAEIHPYPWTVRGFGDNISIVNVMMVNPYKAVDFGTYPAGRHYINGLYAHALKVGLFIDKCFDVGRVENVHFWPFWGEQHLEWTKQNGTAFIIARTDWEYMTNCFAIAYKIGFHFIEKEDGGGNILATQCGSDIGPTAIKVDAVQQHSGCAFVNGQFMAGVDVAETNLGPLKFTNCGFWGYGKTDHQVLLRGSGHTTFSNCHFAWWGQVNRNAPAIIAQTGGITVNACEFRDDEPGKQHIVLEEDVEAAAIYANRFHTKPAIVNRSEGDVVIEANIGGRQSRLLEALDHHNADAVAEIWKKRLEGTSMTSQPIPIRLASAVALTGEKHKPFRKQLLESILETTSTASHERSFGARALDELKLDQGEKPGRPMVHSKRTGAPVKVDGKLNEPDWNTATVTTFGAEVLISRISMLHDDKALYVAIRVGEPAVNNIRTNETQHDGKVWLDDSVEFFLSPRRATHHYFQMIANTAGVLYDGTGNLKRTTAMDWDSSVTVATSISGNSYIVEMAVPYSDIKATPPAAGDIWSADFRRWRYAGGKEDYSSWAKAPLKGFTHHPEAFGFVQFW